MDQLRSHTMSSRSRLQTFGWRRTSMAIRRRIRRRHLTCQVLEPAAIVPWHKKNYGCQIPPFTHWRVHSSTELATVRLTGQSQRWSTRSKSIVSFTNRQVADASTQTSHIIQILMWIFVSSVMKRSIAHGTWLRINQTQRRKIRIIRATMKTRIWSNYVGYSSIQITWNLCVL